MPPTTDAVKVPPRSALGLALLLVSIGILLWNGPRSLPDSPASFEPGPGDWPMSRHDALRSGTTPHSLPPDLCLHWSRRLPAITPAWPDQPKMPFDAVYDPVVVGDSLFLASPLADTITAYDVETGDERWTFVGDGPFRFAPLWWDGKLYAVCDDGYLYCLDSYDGQLLWKFRGGPSDRKVLGNGRLISAWPARGAPVIADGVVYFTASIWPFMGLFIHALDARTGDVVWSNTGDGSIWIKQPHNADSFAGVAPQGHLVVAGDKLLLPGGRSVPACYDRHTGKLLHYRLAENGKKGGGSEVAVSGNVVVNGGATFELETGEFLGNVGDLAVADGATVFCHASGKVQVLDLHAPPAVPKAADSKSKIATWTPPILGSAPLPDALSLVRAGDRLYVGGPGRVGAVSLPLVDGRSRLVWRADVEGKPMRLVAARDRLFVVTLEGRLYCFGPGEVEPRSYNQPRRVPIASADDWSAKAADIMKATGVRDGYCVAWGVGGGRLVRELVAQSNLHVVVIDPDPDRVAEFREEMLAEGLYGRRVCALAVEPAQLPPYLASLMVSEDLADSGLSLAEDLPRVFQSLRPYGGVAWLPVEGDVPAAPPESVVSRPDFGGVLLSRPGPVPGSSNWTHEHGDAANTRVSRDQVVKAPLGLLWFGGTSHEGILPRHGHGPQPQVIDGRVLIEGMDLLRAVDCYTGRMLWEAKLPGVGKIYNNMAHQPGANATGGNFVSASDGIYVVNGKVCVRLDPATGRTVSEFPFPGVGKDETWGYVNLAGDTLIGGSDPTPAFNILKPLAEKLKVLSVLDGDDLSSSRRLVVMDRHTGKLKWGVTAKYGFRHNSICVGGGKLFVVDRLSGLQLTKLNSTTLTERNEETPSRLIVFDLATGKELWSTEKDVFGTWLSYSEKHDVLLEAGRVARDTLIDEPKGIRAYKVGERRVLWYEKDYTGPAMIHGDTVLQGQGACDILTGKPRLRTDPLTGELLPWVWDRKYGCNTPLASAHLLTFRSGAAGFFDLCRDGGTGNVGGFRSSCTNNLIVACGVLSAPDYTRTCTCSYQNQTSLALVPMPDAEMWTFFTARESKKPVKRLGLNLGAPGDRRDDNGTLWLEYPSVGGTSPAVKVTTTPANPEWFRKHASVVTGELPWVTSSGAKGLTSLTLTLDPDAKKERDYTVRLYFLEPDDLAAGERVFSVALQGRPVIADLDVVRETGGSDRALVRELTSIKAGKELVVTLTSSRGGTVLCGVEVVAEGW